ncbi:MAG: hypothetical protein HYZ79_03585 [Candidatus Melainabacteria bacterium]|nr:hypothetical protein [Candidatus Melainabacteria bacterium]
MSTGKLYAADFILPNTGGEPVTVDISNLSLISDIDVTIGSFTELPRAYRNEDTKTLVLFPSAFPNSEQVLQVRAGGSTVTKTISFRPSPDGEINIASLPELRFSRGGAAVTKLSDGRVVIIGGGKTLVSNAINTLEVFDPSTGSVETLKSTDGLKNARLATSRSQHTATYLGINNSPIGMISGPVEQILIAGGFTKEGTILKTLEVLEIKVDSNQAECTLLKGKNSRLKKGRLFHTASLLPNGRVLIIGGQGRINMSSIGALNSIEIFDPVSRAVLSSTIMLSTPRLLHTSTTLQDGNILVVGGFTNEKPDAFEFGPATDSAELIDTKNLTVKPVGLLDNLEGVGGQSATLLTNGLVLIIGGSSDFFSGRSENEFRGLSVGKVRFYDPSTQVFKTVKDKDQGDLLLKTSRLLHESVLLPNGDVAVIGGLNIKPGTSSEVTINTPASTVEVISPDVTFFTGELEAKHKNVVETFTGRIQPNALLVSPKNKVEGFLTTSFINNFTNAGIFVSGGFTNGAGRLPTKSNEFIYVSANEGIEGRKIKLNPNAVVRGSFLDSFDVKIDTFSELPALKIDPQTVNLSSSNDFMANVKVISTNSKEVLLKAEGTDLNSSIIVSPSLFQAGENVSISRKDSSIVGEFEIMILPASSPDSFIPATLKVNVSDSSNPFLATVPGNGLSLSTQAGASSAKVKVKVFSQDGTSELTSIPPQTSVTATLLDSGVANLGGTGISSVVGTLATEFVLNALKPGKTSINFDIDFPDVLSVSIPLEISGTPTFASSAIEPTVISNLNLGGVTTSGTVQIDSTNITLENLSVSSTASLFPIYVPINLISSIDATTNEGLFTLSPIFGPSLQTAFPRTLVSSIGDMFRPSIFTSMPVIGGIVPSDGLDPIAFFAINSEIRSLSYKASVSEKITSTPSKLSTLTDTDDMKFLETGGKIFLIALRGDKLSIIDALTGELNGTITLSGKGKELALTKIGEDNAAVVSVGGGGVDLVFPLIVGGTRVVNFQLGGVIEHIASVEKLGDEEGPFVIAFDGVSTISITDLEKVGNPIASILTTASNISKIAYAGKYNVNNKETDVLVAASGRKILLFDLNNLSSISIGNEVKIKDNINDLVVINGVAYLALGADGISAISIGSLIDSNSTYPEIAEFKQNKLIEVRSNGTQRVGTRKINSFKLADSDPFLLSTGQGNDLTVIRVSP